MGDVGDLYRAMKAARVEHKKDSMSHCLARLEELSIPYVVLSTVNCHLRIACKIDFWPTTQKWWLIGTKRKGYGLNSMLKEYERQVGFLDSVITGEKV